MRVLGLITIWLLLWSPMLAQQTATETPQAKPSWADDAAVRVWLEPQIDSADRWFPPRIQQRVVLIKQFNDQEFSAIERGTQNTISVSATRVIWIEPLELPEREQNAVTLFETQKYDEALRPLLDAITDRPPVWRQQWLSIVAAQAALRSGRYKIALELTSQMDAHPLPPLVVSWLPILWQSQALAQDATMLAAANERLQDPSPAVRLVAASWLLFSPSRKQATTTLQSLAADKMRPQLAKLASSLLWNTVPPPEVLAAASDWQQQIASLPMVFQTGPTLTMISKLKSSGNAAQAKSWERSLKRTPIQPHPDMANPDLPQ